MKLWDLKLVTGPAAGQEPVTLAEAKQQVRLTEDFTDDDAQLNTLIKASREWVEEETSRVYCEQTFDLLLWYFPPWGSIRIPRAPLKQTGGIVHVKYLNSDGTQTPLAAATGYVVNHRADPPTVDLPYGASWPGIRQAIGAAGEWPVEVRFIAGYGTTVAAMPNRVRQAMLLHMEAGYDRDAANHDLLMERALTLLASKRAFVTPPLP